MSTISENFRINFTLENRRKLGMLNNHKENSLKDKQLTSGTLLASKLTTHF